MAPIRNTGTNNTLYYNTSSKEITYGNSGIGISQTWQDLTASRSSGTTYTNSTGKPIMVLVKFDNSNLLGTVNINGINITNLGNNGTTGGSNIYSFIVPDTNTYTITFGNLSQWLELRQDIWL